MELDDQIFGQTFSFKLTPEQHEAIHQHYEAITGTKDHLPQKAFMAIVLERAIREATGDSGQLVSQVEELRSQVNSLQQANIQLEAEARSSRDMNSILVNLEPADLVFIDLLIEAAKKKYPQAEITRQVYIRALIRGLYESGHIYATRTFSDREIKQIREKYSAEQPAHE